LVVELMIKANSVLVLCGILMSSE